MFRWLFVEVYGSPVHQWLVIGIIVGLVVGGIVSALLIEAAPGCGGWTRDGLDIC